MSARAAVQFFREHAGYSYDPKRETQLQGRMRCARALATAEARARDEGYSFQWVKDDDSDSRDFNDDDPRYQLWGCVIRAPDGEVAGSLWAIDFGSDKEPWGDPYRRVVEAELAAEHLL